MLRLRLVALVDFRNRGPKPSSVKCLKPVFGHILVIPLIYFWPQKLTLTHSSGVVYCYGTP